MKKWIRICLPLLLIAILIFGGCAVGTLMPDEPYDIPPVSVDPSKYLTFKLATYNLWGGMMTAEKIETNRAYFENQGYDAVALQEIDRNTSRSGNIDYLARLTTGDFPYHAFAPTYVPGFDDKYGLGAIARNPLSDVHVFRLPYPYPNLHSDVEQRVLLRFVVCKDGVPVVLYVTHLSYENVACGNTTLRAAQIEYIKNVLARDPAPYKLLAGDFNIERIEELQPLADAGMTPVLRDASLGYTYHGDDGDLLIDNILYSPALTPIPDTVKIVTGLGTSDHNLLEATFTKTEAL